jgi:xylono-1,5-lactonase
MAGFEVIASGFGVVEAPTLDDEGGIYFSDVPRGGLYRLAPTGGVETLVEKRKGIGGICLHRDGGVVVSGRDIAHIREDGGTRILLSGAQCPAPGPVMGFNDLCADDRGRVLVGPVQLDADRQKVPQNFLRIGAEGQGEILYPDVKGSNGVGVDARHRRIYHAATRAKEIIVSTIGDDDAVTIDRRFSTAAIEGVPDGLRIDADGCVWVAFFEGGSVVRFSPEGEILDRIAPPSRYTTSLCFGGSDMRDMYIGSHDNIEHPELEGCLFLTRSPVAGLPPNRAAI